MEMLIEYIEVSFFFDRIGNIQEILKQLFYQICFNEKSNHRYVSKLIAIYI